MPTIYTPVPRYPRQPPQPHITVQLDPLADPLHVRLEPHLSSASLHKLSNWLESTTQPTLPPQHSFVTSFFSSSQLLPPQPSAEDSRVAKPTTTIHDLIDFIVFPFYFPLAHLG
jgi:hypothetical protein